MNILFVLSQVELTGAETYSASLIQELKKSGHQAVVVSDTWRQEVEAKYFPLPVDNTSFVKRLRNIKFLSKIIKEEEINLLHAHSRASSWVSHFAAKLTGVHYVVTVHSFFPSYLKKKVLPCVGDRTIVICEKIKEHLIDNLKVKEENIFLIPNGIDTERFIPLEENEKLKNEFRINQEKVITWIGRFSGPRSIVLKEIIKRILPELSKKISDFKFFIVAGEKKQNAQEIKKLTSELNSKLGKEVVIFTGLREDIPQIISLSTLVIGAGRVVLEAMSCGKPVVAIGENKLIGLINQKNFAEAKRTNFGDCCFQEEFNWAKLTEEISEIINNKEKRLAIGRWGRELVLNEFNLKDIAQKVMKVYASLTS